MKIPCSVIVLLIVLQYATLSDGGLSFLQTLLESAWTSSDPLDDNTEQIDNPCCSFPCENRGVCMTTGVGRFECDCEGTGYYGPTCEKPTFWKRVVWLIKPDSDFVHELLTEAKHSWIWTIVNRIPGLSDAVMKRIYLIRGAMVDSPATYTSEHDYITYEAYGNRSYFARALPPVPKDCPTPLGVVGAKELPDAGMIVDKLMKRTVFKPDPRGSNALFTFFAQHFTHQFFKTDFQRGPGFQWGGHGVDVSHVYGKDKHVENMLRSFEDGKLKMQTINGESWPLLLKDVEVPMHYPPSVPKEIQFALGHKDFGLLPGLFMYATIWMREHNRVCDILKGEHPEWDDERLFQTTKLVILGETIKVVVENYVQHLSNYNYQLVFKPELLFGQSHQYSNRITAEFNHMYHWHPLMPDEFNISGTTYTVKDFLFRPDIVLKHGMRDFVDGLVHQRAGAFTHHNHNFYTLPVAKQTILHGRALRYQSFNQYRKRFSLPPYQTFEDLTGDTEVAKDLEEIYGDIDAVEFYVGIVVEKTRPKAIFGSTVIERGGPFSVKGLLSAPICSPQYWKPSTFGGDVGFDLVKTASLEKLFCKNMADCPKISFEVPKGSESCTKETQSCTKNEL
ncbi:prostaglandin G/H synthase 2-like isoform X1 [Mercenaria mercenaria]|uniref:prostaglandin G/H synthase 2-like isoform X1 n=2 Tax=Mercenaria mercenaria TaxID=6596 RepID=UPI00234F8931|nr:prostaglandin G/H synthase 2-like isoform X1 [Mercenaria mercenaria]XP_053381121.1 prostaglandin G/H synthase 2-like isoform X1 [Mercenaria mercenaria]XP_053381122.1 prostaglandin G/H synthase 2-like isoform X1 [Mercenaria mercenaria]XP_053381124.1 prostaglandin G/H synthase 2-like isoform X1 [Mercenaria mercenaria]XP_053381125.1 prostaglandin G/H synthase 2-like isoform X1 [Mercenaria mercenaria]